MTDLARHASWAVSVNGSVAAGIVDGSLQVSPSIQKAVLYASGDLRPTLGATLTSTPTISFRTRRLDLLAAPAKITSFLVGARAYDDAGGLGAGYISMAVSEGLLVPVSISAGAGQAAELACVLYPISANGSSDPITVGSTSAVLGVHGDAYTAGDLIVGGSTISGVQSLSVEFGYNVVTNAGENGRPYPTLAYVDRQEAMISATVAQLSAATQARVNTGQATAMSASFMRLAEGAVPSGSYSAAMAKAIVEAASLQGGRPFTAQLKGVGIYDGSGDDYLSFSAA